jgi:hypothetical protein
LLVAALLAGCGSAAGSGPSGAVAPSAYSASLHFDRGRQTLSFRLHEPAGVILLYRLTAPRGAEIRASAQLPRVTVPLWIATAPAGPSSPCTELGTRLSCTVGEEWCPIPEGNWRFRVDKRAGPAGDVMLVFRVGNPPAQAAARGDAVAPVRAEPRENA